MKLLDEKDVFNIRFNKGCNIVEFKLVLCFKLNNTLVFNISSICNRGLDFIELLTAIGYKDLWIVVLW